MTTEWVLTTAAERVTLNAQRQGEMTFTVTNPSNVADRVVFDVVPGEGADPTWFQVDEPQRAVRGTASVSYLVKAVVPTQAKPGEYAVQGRVYSADSAPEESSVLSNRVMLAIRPAETPQRRRIPWWIYAIAALIVIVLVAVTITLIVTHSGTPSNGPTTPTGPTVTVPDLSKATATTVVSTLQKDGLAGKVTYKQDPARTGLVEQSLPAGSVVARGSTVMVIFHVSLQLPQQISPGLGARVPINALPALTWKDPDAFVHNWEVRIFLRACFFGGIASGSPCSDLLTEDVKVTQPTYTPIAKFTLPPAGASSVYHNGVFFWQIIPLDDDGAPGPATPSWGEVAA